VNRRQMKGWIAAAFVAAGMMAGGVPAAAQTGSPTAKPAAAQTTKPQEPAKPAPAKPATATPATAKPATAQPATAKPATAKPATAKPARPRAATSPGAGPVVVVETERGVFEFETYPKEAPKTVEHILALVKRNFYNGQRIHRVASGFVIQFGDPNTKDMTRQEVWGRGGSGKPIGVAEMHPNRPHKVGAVAMAHSGDPAGSDSQMYVSLDTAATKQLDGKYTVFGQVISGMDVVMKTEKNDMIKRVTIRSDAPAPAPAPVPAAK